MTDQQQETPEQLREAAERGRKALRENAFLKAGINPDDAKMKYFVKAYDGELDPEAIKAEATEAGLLGAPAPAAEEPPSDEPPARRAPTDEETQFDAMAEVGAEGAPAATQTEEDLLKVGWEKYAERRTNGSRREEASAEVITRIIGGAVNGDKRFLVP